MPPPSPVPPPDPEWPIPKFGLRVDDLSHEGAAIFFDSVSPKAALHDAVLTTFKWLYTLETVPTNVQSILLVLRPMAGVAHTQGGHTQKEIHFSLDYIKGCALRAPDEILGVLTHEVVHCYQYNGKDKCPAGLIEGMADWVRLRAGLDPPHWKRDPDDKWDAGYEKTAYFLEWIERRYGDGTVRDINESMKHVEYHDHIFKEATGRKLPKLWRLYCEDTTRTAIH